MALDMDDVELANKLSEYYQANEQELIAPQLKYLASVIKGE